MMNLSNHKLDIIAGKRWLEISLLLMNDVVGFVVAIGFVTLARYFFFVDLGENLFDPQVIRTIFVTVIFSVIMLAIKGLYPGQGRISVMELKQVFEAVALTYAIVGVFIFIQRANINFSRSVFILSSFFAIIIISIGRFLVRKLIARFPWWGEPVVIIGLEEDILATRKRLVSCARLGFRPAVGLSLDSVRSRNAGKMPIFPWSLEMQRAVHDSNIKTNILAASTSELRENYPQVYQSVGLSFEKTIFLVDNDIYGTMMAQPVDLNGAPAIISRQSLFSPTQRLIKWVFEILCIIILLPPILAVYLVLAIFIKLDSPGPVLYTQERVGRHRKLFRLYKFRTMMTNSDQILKEMLQDPQIREEWEEFHKISNDRRITRVGRWIRKFSLDELPQFINILRGEMSLIGPRPLIQSEIDELGEVADLILHVRPGLAGWWQVNGRSNLSFKERTQLDLYYVFNWSLWLDLFIFFKSFWVILVDRSGK